MPVCSGLPRPCPGAIIALRRSPSRRSIAPDHRLPSRGAGGGGRGRGWQGWQPSHAGEGRIWAGRFSPPNRVTTAVSPRDGRIDMTRGGVVWLGRRWIDAAARGPTRGRGVMVALPWRWKWKLCAVVRGSLARLSRFNRITAMRTRLRSRVYIFYSRRPSTWEQI